MIRAKPYPGVTGQYTGIWVEKGTLGEFGLMVQHFLCGDPRPNGASQMLIWMFVKHFMIDAKLFDLSEVHHVIERKNYERDEKGLKTLLEFVDAEV